MDQIKTGKFISALRKEKNLTQLQLADILGISDKTISKWERGAGLPDVSLMIPLCEALEISRYVQTHDFPMSLHAYIQFAVPEAEQLDVGQRAF